MNPCTEIKTKKTKTDPTNAFQVMMQSSKELSALQTRYTYSTKNKFPKMHILSTPSSTLKSRNEKQGSKKRKIDDLFEEVAKVFPVRHNLDSSHDEFDVETDEIMIEDQLRLRKDSNVNDIEDQPKLVEVMLRKGKNINETALERQTPET